MVWIFIEPNHFFKPPIVLFDIFNGDYFHYKKTSKHNLKYENDSKRMSCNSPA